MVISSSQSESEDETSTQIMSGKLEEVVQELSLLEVGDSHGMPIYTRLNWTICYHKFFFISSLKYLRSISDERKMLSAGSSWRSILSKYDVWYASFGSNMWTPRFLSYIAGGQVNSPQIKCYELDTISISYMQCLVCNLSILLLLFPNAPWWNLKSSKKFSIWTRTVFMYVKTFFCCGNVNLFFILLYACAVLEASLA